MTAFEIRAQESCSRAAGNYPSTGLITHFMVLYTLGSVPGGSSSKTGLSRNPAARGSCPFFLKESRISKICGSAVAPCSTELMKVGEQTEIVFFFNVNRLQPYEAVLMQG